MKQFGYEFIVDCKGADNIKIRSLENIQAFVDELIEKTGMQKMCSMHSYYLPDTIDNREMGIIGWSICQFIQTSSITAHFCEGEYNGTIYLNFFSCKLFEAEDVIRLLIKYFNCFIVNKHFLDRNAC